MSSTATADSPILKEAKRRRTFAIISHPDAGKTTLTEKLLLYGGAIHEAGSVRARKASHHAASDWMAIEKERGISVTSSVMRFEKDGIKYNLLDTPGHKDFSEDTLRTLVAADCGLMVIDVAKGVEEQTEKLFEVCKLREVPVITFVNKCDRPGMDPLEVLSNVESKLGIEAVPASWPLGYGQKFQGIYDVIGNKVHVYEKADHGAKKAITETMSVEQALEQSNLSDMEKDAFREEVMLIEDMYPNMDKELYNTGKVTPVFFGSALNNFGVRELLDCFVEIAPKPRPKESDTRLVKPEEKEFSGFVFKIHANMDPKHRDRLAFVKIVSGTFERNTPYLHVRNGKKMKFSSPNAFFAEKKEIVDVSYPGDIVGLHDTGNFKIGDTLTQGEEMNYRGIPSFSPEHFKYINNADPMKSKQLEKGIDQLMDEGVAQLFTLELNGRKVIGTVGALQFEVIQYRLEHEYGAKCTYENLNVHKACWVEAKDPKSAEFADFTRVKSKFLAKDKRGQLVFFADSAFTLQMTQSKYPTIKLHFVSEFKKEA